jgi:hypothetical protein
MAQWPAQSAEYLLRAVDNAFLIAVSRLALIWASSVNVDPPGPPSANLTPAPVYGAPSDQR